MTADILSLAHEVLALDRRADASNLGGDWSVRDEMDWREACRTAAPELARSIALLDKLTTQARATEPGDDAYSVGWNHALTMIRTRLGLDTTEGGR